MRIFTPGHYQITGAAVFMNSTQCRTLETGQIVEIRTRQVPDSDGDVRVWSGGRDAYVCARSLTALPDATALDVRIAEAEAKVAALKAEREELTITITESGLYRLEGNHGFAIMIGGELYYSAIGGGWIKALGNGIGWKVVEKIELGDL